MVVFPGRPGGPAGPDFRDAVLARPNGERLCGDVELHLRARGWHAHGHDGDPRYASVVLHVVRHAEGATATPLASGATAALVELGSSRGAPIPSTRGAGTWPCLGLARRLKPDALRALLSATGDARFAERAESFTARLAAAEKRSGAWQPIDRALLVALAEGLAYGHDREALRRAGEWLADGGTPDGVLRDLPRLGRMDALRLEGLLALHAGWSVSGPWAPLHAALDEGTPAAAAGALVAALVVPGGLVSRGRACILAANVAIPCAAAWAAQHNDRYLLSRTCEVYAALPGLPSNQITREMVRQLGLPRQPSGARAQQGLHHLWWQHQSRPARGRQAPLPRPVS